MRNKIIYFIVWIFVLLIGPFTVIKNTPISLLSSSQSVLINFLQRIVGLTLFSLITWQIILGSFMDRWIQKLGGWVFKFHVTEGVFIYSLVILHPLLFVLFNFKVTGKLDPFYVFTDICVLCPKPIEYLYTLGRFSFWLVNVTVFAALFRTHPLLRTHWRKFHILNYAVFFLVAIHSYFVGTDTHTAPFSYLYWLSVGIISLIVTYKISRLFFRKA